ncbi:MAG TPA: hypothetical protein VGC08_14390 [Pedobacter sp.]
MKEDSTFQDIILNHFNTPEDQILLQKVTELRALSADHERIYQETKTIWDTALLTKRLYLIDNGLSVRRFKEQLQDRDVARPRVFAWYKVAAAAAVLVIITYLIYPKKAVVEELVNRPRSR